MKESQRGAPGAFRRRRAPAMACSRPSSSRGARQYEDGRLGAEADGESRLRARRRDARRGVGNPGPSKAVDVSRSSSPAGERVIVEGEVDER